MIVAQQGLGSTTDLPDPAVDMDADWFMYQSIARPAPPTRGATDGNAISQRWVIDSKANRKLMDHKAIYWSIQHLNSPGDVTYSCAVRFLVALP